MRPLRYGDLTRKKEAPAPKGHNGTTLPAVNCADQGAGTWRGMSWDGMAI